MQREKAVEMIREIGYSCRLLNPKEIDLEETGRKGHFEIHIKCHVDDESWGCLKELAKKKQVGIRQMDHTLVIYAPVSRTIGTLRIG